MFVINKNSIEKIFEKIDGAISEPDIDYIYDELFSLEMKNKVYNNEMISDEIAINYAMRKIKYHLSRFSSEKYSKNVVAIFNRYMRALEQDYSLLEKCVNKEKQIALLKDCITFVELSMDLDITFYTSLFNLYKYCIDNETKRLSLLDIQRRYQGRRL